mmetsp:Transcript_13550/g.43535  ORF Transcript_13550/g.43535 Transcript_13550/m.43535 type:complete len:694 (+) Transcript_13550:55-2136(+)
MSICELPKAGLNLLVSGCDAFENCNVSQSWSAQLPSLPPSTQQQLRFAPAGAPASNASFITFGALLSLAPIGSAYYGYSRGMKGSLELFERLVQERGGLLVNGTRRPFRFAIVSDESRLDLTTNATAHAIRGLGADFMLGGFSSGFTNYAARQSYADKTIMLATTAATPSVISQNNLTFGVLPPSPRYIKTAVEAIVDAADACDSRLDRCWRGMPPRCRGATCRESLKAGFIAARTKFTSVMCSLGAGVTQEAGVPVALNSSGLPLITTVAPAFSVGISQEYIDDIKEALQPLRDEGVTLLVGCTYLGTGKGLMLALQQLGWAPLAVVTTATLSEGRIHAELRSTAPLALSWAAEYTVEPMVWHPSLSGRGTWSNLTSIEFTRQFQRANGGELVSYIGAAAFAASCSLADAIERAGSLETDEVAAALNSATLFEFFSNLTYNKDGQADEDMMVLQFQPGRVDETVVAGVANGRTVENLPIDLRHAKWGRRAVAGPDALPAANLGATGVRAAAAPRGPQGGRKYRGDPVLGPRPLRYGRRVRLHGRVPRRRLRGRARGRGQARAQIDPHHRPPGGVRRRPLGARSLLPQPQSAPPRRQAGRAGVGLRALHARDAPQRQGDSPLGRDCRLGCAGDEPASDGRERGGHHRRGAAARHGGRAPRLSVACLELRAGPGAGNQERAPRTREGHPRLPRR